MPVSCIVCCSLQSVRHSEERHFEGGSVWGSGVGADVGNVCSPE